MVVASIGACGDSGEAPSLLDTCRNDQLNGTSVNTSQSSPAVVEQRCMQEGGMHCLSAIFISQATAECIARAEMLPVGIRPWRSSLDYHLDRRMPAWTVQSTTEISDSAAGIDKIIHATTGQVLDSRGWRAIP
jgi:hypothetical protein